MWNAAQKFEQDWWDTCQNTYGEETKQLVYAQRMGLSFTTVNGKPYHINMGGKQVLDIGGGPTSLLLKCLNVRGVVADPCNFPQWIYDRYIQSGILFERTRGEDLEADVLCNAYGKFDEVWIYNVLQHTESPQRIIFNARQIAPIIRLFEWVDTRESPGHPQVLRQAELDKWLKGTGKVEYLDLPNSFCNGYSYYGVFVGEQK